MSARRWLIRLLLLGTISFSTQAKIFTTPILAEANELLQTNPEQSLVMTTRYLDQRRLSAPKETSRVHINDETDHSVRTPLSTVNALQIVAKAHLLLNQPDKAQAAIKQAIEISSEEKLTFSRLESQLIHADIYWGNLKNSARSLKMLDQYRYRDCSQHQPDARQPDQAPAVPIADAAFNYRFGNRPGKQGRQRLLERPSAT